jgi:hypothetical protein
MPFPPNYNQNRKDRERAKNRKLEEKLARREAKSRERKTDQPEELTANPPAGEEQK